MWAAELFTRSRLLVFLVPILSVPGSLLRFLFRCHGTGHSQVPGDWERRAKVRPLRFLMIIPLDRVFAGWVVQSALGEQERVKMAGVEMVKWRPLARIDDNT